MRLFDSVVAGSAEVRSFVTPQEIAAGSLSQARKIEVMRAMCDASQAGGSVAPVAEGCA
ncbi:hypothetical protein F4560_002108 [Saccharothrix ecbatanensis]|uniref:Uncharacterized protein n=1 Tax=Saccharothrix ecbatanensis TaxID=1105145 RepID=A0A7W9HHP0_9PSEU|nr:hypothetical protein [Saccharothrix ecbatanensis]MBB5802340.1 hypothetical protein [Saccharothrix ecbatanensis]